jgi:hypothetical protein
MKTVLLANSISLVYVPGRCGISSDYKYVVNRHGLPVVEAKTATAAFAAAGCTGEVVEQQVQTQTSPCHLDGQHHWFTCPRCAKRVAVLYAPGVDVWVRAA